MTGRSGSRRRRAAGGVRRRAAAREGEDEASAPSRVEAEGIGRHILVVDDEPDIAAMLGEILDAAGFRVTVVESGRAALDLLARLHFDWS